MANKKTVLRFNEVYAAEPGETEKKIAEEMINVWGKFEPGVAKNPALIRKGVLFGISLARQIWKERAEERKRLQDKATAEASKQQQPVQKLPVQAK